jgi:C4-dicarboxylate-specific signal transduction histidine kinase
MPIFSDPMGIGLIGFLLLALLVLAAVLLERRHRRQLVRCQGLLQQTQADLAACQSSLSQLQGRLHDLQHTSHLAASVAHEINQPLSAMRLLAQQSQVEGPAGPATQDGGPAGLMGRLEQEIDRLVSITETLRLLLRSQDTRLESVDLARVVRAVLLYLKRPLRLAEVRLTSGGLEQPLTIAGDPQQLQAALTVLLRQALASLAQTPPSDRLLTIHLANLTGAAELVISDSGPWDSSAWSLDLETGTAAEANEDLGLYVVRVTAANHGGQCSLGRSPDLGGRQVRLLLPL